MTDMILSGDGNATPANATDRSNVALLEALQEIARWSGNSRVKWYVDRYALILIEEERELRTSQAAAALAKEPT